MSQYVSTVVEDKWIREAIDRDTSLKPPAREEGGLKKEGAAQLEKKGQSQRDF